MSHISDCVAALATDKFPNVVPGWPRAEHDREVRAEITCLDCGCVDHQTRTMKGTPEPPDFDDWCENCGSCHVKGRIFDDAELDDQVNEFGTWACDCCGSGLAGARFAVTGLPENPAENEDYITYEVCIDCYYFIVNGEELES